MSRWTAWLAPIVFGGLLTACGWVEVEGQNQRTSPPPPSAPEVTIENGQRVVAVRPGDTMFGLANQLDVTRRQMIVLNDLAAPYTLRSGQKLRLPSDQTLHRVQSGETLSEISETYGVDLKRLAAHNLIVPPYDIQSNQLVGVPRNGRRIVARAPAPSTNSIATEVLPPPTAPPPAVVAAPEPPPSPPVAVVTPQAQPQPEPPRAQREPSPTPVAPPVVATAPAQPPAAAPARPAPPPLQRGGPGAATPGQSGGFLVPVEGPVIAAFGSQADGRRNDGVNIAAPKGASVRAAADGEVVYAGDALQGYGNLVLVRHKDDWVTAYAHLERILAKRGDTVKRGQTIGAVGSTGGVATSQLHFEMRLKNRAVDPKGKLAAK